MNMEKISGVPYYMKLQQFVRRSWKEDVWRDVDSSGMLNACVKRIRGPFKHLSGQFISCCTETMHRYRCWAVGVLMPGFQLN